MPRLAVGADSAVRRAAAPTLKATGDIVSSDEVVEVPMRLEPTVVVEAGDGGVLEDAVQPLDLTSRSRSVDLGRAD